MTVLDSSAWLEYFAGTEKADLFSEYAEDFEKLIVPTICIYEVYKKILVQKNQELSEIAIDFMRNGKVKDLNTEISILAAQTGYKYKIPMADSIIYATCIINNAKLITQDADFIGLDNVEYYSKK